MTLVQLLSCVQLCVTPGTAAHQASLSVTFPAVKETGCVSFSEAVRGAPGTSSPQPQGLPMGMPPHQLRTGDGVTLALSTACPQQAPRRACSTSGGGATGDEGQEGRRVQRLQVKETFPRPSGSQSKFHFLLQLSSKPSFAGNTPVWVSLVQFESLTPDRLRLLEHWTSVPLDELTSCLRQGSQRPLTSTSSARLLGRPRQEKASPDQWSTVDGMLRCRLRRSSVMICSDDGI